MNKAKLERMYQDKLNEWLESWHIFIQRLDIYLPEKAKQLFNSRDDVFDYCKGLNKAEAEKLDKAMDSYQKDLLLDLGFDAEAWSSWLDSIKDFPPDTDEPDLSVLPEHLSLPPHDPDTALEQVKAWRYSANWQGLIELGLALCFATAKVRLNLQSERG